MKVTLEKVFANVKPTKFGDKLSVGLKVRETQVTDINGATHSTDGKYLNAWFPATYTFPHKEGESIEILVKERNGYLDFSLPGVGKPPQPDVSNLVERVAKLEAAVFGGTIVPDSQEPVDPDNF